MWQEGSIRIYDTIFHYCMKVYKNPSIFGIDGGRISKLAITRNGITVCNYDRGWDIKADEPAVQLALEILIHDNN